MNSKTISVMFGMDTHEITVTEHGTVHVKVYTDFNGVQDGGDWANTFEYVEDMTLLGYGRAITAAFERNGIPVEL